MPKLILSSKKDEFVSCLHTDKIVCLTCQENMRNSAYMENDHIKNCEYFNERINMLMKNISDETILKLQKKALHLIDDYTFDNHRQKTYTYLGNLLQVTERYVKEGAF
jgi:hypothetical protein